MVRLGEGAGGARPTVLGWLARKINVGRTLTSRSFEAVWTWESARSLDSDGTPPSPRDGLGAVAPWREGVGAFRVRTFGWLAFWDASTYEKIGCDASVATGKVSTLELRAAYVRLL